MADALDAICDDVGRPKVKLHGLRMLNPAIFSEIPFASADSTNVVQNKTGSRWDGPYVPKSAEIRAFVLADRIEAYNSPATWRRGEQTPRRYALAATPLFGGC